jgi:hypothetical protein
MAFLREKYGECAACLKNSVRTFVEKIYKMECLEDNWYTSYPLAVSLLKDKINLVGTLKKNKKKFPLNFCQTKTKKSICRCLAFKSKLPRSLSHLKEQVSGPTLNHAQRYFS